MQHSVLHSDESFIGSLESIEYDNLVHKESMVYYFNPNMYAGILIDIHPDKLETNRRVYSLTGWLGEVVGFSSAILPIF